MLELIERARQLGLTLLSPPSPALLDAWELRTGHTLPADVRAFYTVCDGFEEDDFYFSPYPFTPSEEFFEDFSDWYAPDEQDLAQTLLPLAMDIGGNLLALMVETPCAGRLVYINHESPHEPTPIFTSFYSALAAQLEVYGDEDADLTTDYPAVSAFTGDADAANACINMAQTAQGDPQRLFYLSLACGVLPLERTDEMIGWLDVVTEARPVWEALAARKWNPAVPALAQLMLRRESEGATYGSDLSWIAEALADIGTLDAKASLLELGNQLSATQLLALERALKKLGASVERVSSVQGRGYALQVQFRGEAQILLQGREAFQG